MLKPVPRPGLEHACHAVGTPIELRAACPSDARAIAWLTRCGFRQQARLLALSKRECPAYVGFETAARVRQRLLGGEQIWLATAGQRLIGTVGMRLLPASASEPCGEIGRLAVLPHRRGAGHGLSLMQAAEHAIAAAGAGSARLSIVARFDALRRYYERQGYAATQLRRYPGLPFEVLHLEKCLRRRT